MSKFELIKIKIDKLIANQKKFDFPQFLFQIRKCYGLPRRTVCKDISFSEMKMFHLENGYFRTFIPLDELCRISEYYSIDNDLFEDKMTKFILEGKGIPQHKNLISHNKVRYGQ